MESAKPIEAGCICLVVGEGNFPLEGHFKGAVVTAIQPIAWGEVEYGDLHKNETLWEVDKKCLNGSDAVLPASMLLRINDPDIQKQIEQERALENV